MKKIFLILVIAIMQHSVTFSQEIYNLKKVNKLLYPNSIYKINNFVVRGNGVVYLPLEGGIYMPGLNCWYLKPSQKTMILDMAQTLEGNDILYIIGKNTQKIILHDDKEPFKALTDLEKGEFYLVPINKDLVYIIGKHEDDGFGIWRFFNKKIQNIFKSRSPITICAALDKNTLVFSIDKSLILFKVGKTPKIILQTDADIDGLAITTEGNIFISTLEGVYRLNKNSKVDIIALGIHGSLKYHNSKLYISFQAKNLLLEIALNK